MPDKATDVIQGTLDMLVLKTLALEPMHGYGISVRIEQMSKGVFRPNAGSLFLAIQRLERGWTHRWRMEANREQQASKILRSDAEGTKETQ
jgi:DNA-binding PadR family transcriptional regulator